MAWHREIGCEGCDHVMSLGNRDPGEREGAMNETGGSRTRMLLFAENLIADAEKADGGRA
jgi:hypothetical protein